MVTTIYTLKYTLSYSDIVPVNTSYTSYVLLIVFFKNILYTPHSQQVYIALNTILYSYALSIDGQKYINKNNEQNRLKNYFTLYSLS